jgi:isochorismate synthase EntC
MTQTENSNYLTYGAFYRKPNGQIIAYFPPFEEKSFENSDTSVVIQDFFGATQKSYTAKCQKTFKNAEEFLLFLGPSDNKSLFSRQDFEEPAKEKFIESFKSIQKKLIDDEITKAVPIVISGASFPPKKNDILFWIQKLLKSPPELHVFGFWQDGMGILGATPEILFHRQGNQISTMALAGTIPKNNQIDLTHFINDPKETKEHKIVVEDILSRFKKFELNKLSHISVENMKVLELPKLYHLLTQIRIEVENYHFQEWIKMLHPTSALGWAPRDIDTSWFKELPYQKQRGSFGAPVMFRVSKDEDICLVAIRSIMWNSQQTQVAAGCGVVKESDLDKEWTELRNKLNSIFSSIGI